MRTNSIIKFTAGLVAVAASVIGAVGREAAEWRRTKIQTAHGSLVFSRSFDMHAI